MLDKIAHINPRRILDIGANVGYFFRNAAELWPAAEFFLIEGNEACRPYLKETGQPFAIAYLGDTNREVDFYKRKGGGTDTGNSYYRELTDFFKDGDIDVERVQLKTLREVAGFMPFDLIKIDVQGAELDVIRGGITLVRHASHVLMEVAVERYNEGAPLQNEVYSFMEQIGFPERQIIEEIVHPIERHLVQLDVLFSKSATSQVAKS